MAINITAAGAAGTHSFVKTNVHLTDNFIGEMYEEYADIIQTAYRLFKMRSPLRTWRRLSVLREELIAAAMHPDRYGNY